MPTYEDVANLDPATDQPIEQGIHGHPLTHECPAVSRHEVGAVFPKLGDPLQASLCDLGEGRLVLEGHQRQRLGEAVEHLQLETLDIYLADIWDAVPSDEPIQGDERNGDGPVPRHGGKGSLLPSRVNVGDGGGLPGEVKRRLPLCGPDRNRFDIGVQRQQESAAEVGLGLHCDDGCSEAQEHPRPLALVRAYVETQVFGFDKGPEEGGKTPTLLEIVPAAYQAPGCSTDHRANLRPTSRMMEQGS